MPAKLVAAGRAALARRDGEYFERCQRVGEPGGGAMGNNVACERRAWAIGI